MSPSTVDRVERLRVVPGDPSEPITPAALRMSAVLVAAAAAPEDNTRGLIPRLAPWWHYWPEQKRSFRDGIWRCVVDVDDDAQDYEGARSRQLPFHNDMTKYARPPEFVAIRSVATDPGGGGANRLVHVDDAVARLRDEGRADLLELLLRRRSLMLRDGSEVEGALIVEGDPHAPSRIFDAEAATRGRHAELRAGEAELLAEFTIWCAETDGLSIAAPLEPGDVLLFSNYRFLHARERCLASGRVTDVCLGDETAA